MPILEVDAESREPTSAWYALHTHYQHEKYIARALGAKGFEIFLPLYATVHRWKDRNKRLSLPLFPCYVFLKTYPDRWQPILATPGVHQVVGFGGRPSVIPSSEIEAVQRMVEGPFKAEPHPFLECGDRVRLTAGPLQGLEGLLLRKKSLWKLVVSVEMLQRSVSVEIDSSMVELVSFAQPRFAAFSPTDAVA